MAALMLAGPVVVLSASRVEDVGMGRPYAIVHTGQDRCTDDHGVEISPVPGGPFDGQDAQHVLNPMVYAVTEQGTVRDVVTGLEWTRVPEACTYWQAVELARVCRVGGRDDWRLPSVKEIYSLMDFRGGSGFSPMRAYIDTSAFEFHFNAPGGRGRAIDAQYWTSTEYVGLTMNGDATVFGVNFADGRIKGYPRDRHPVEGEMRRWARFVRGNPAYGKNDFVDRGDGTVVDRATGLIWSKADSGHGMNWKDALAYASSSTLAGHTDWRVPTAKELQSIVDYSRAPDAVVPSKRGPAIDPVFEVSEVESYFWTSTTHYEAPGKLLGTQAVYVCFGRALGKMPPPPRGGGGPTSRRRPAPVEVRTGFINVHGAGAQRSDPKSGDPADAKYRGGFGPQGDDVRIRNYVRLVRVAKGEAR
jgi:hypothetical protein